MEATLEIRNPNVGTVEEFESKFRPVNQSKDPSEEAILIDWSTPAFGAVKKANPRNVWTVVDCDQHQNESGMVVAAGLRYCNRVGYVITEVPWITGDEEFDY